MEVWVGVVFTRVMAYGTPEKEKKKEEKKEEQSRAEQSRDE